MRSDPGQHAGAAGAMLDLLPELVNRYRVSDHVITYCNEAWAALYGTRPSDAEGTKLDAYLSPDELDGLHSQLALLGPDTPVLTDGVARAVSGDGERWIEWADRYLEGDEEPEVLSVGRDVTDRHLAELRLVESERRFRDLAEKSSDIVWRAVTHPVVKIDYLSPSVETILGYPPSSLMDDLDLVEVVTGRTTADLLAAARLRQPVGSLFDVRLRHADGSTVVGETSVAIVPNGVQGVTRDVTELRRLQMATAELATRDPLTGLLNRRGFFTHLAAALDRTERDGVPLAVAYFDLDGLKVVNDEFGHRAGDRVLEETARRLLSVVDGDDLVARLGGDEFAVVYEPSLPSSVDLVRRLDGLLAQPIRISADLAVECGASIGEADTRVVGRRADDLLAAADHAMYDVKRSRRRVVPHRA